MRLILTYLSNMLTYIIVALPIYLICRLIFIKRTKKQVKVFNEILLTIFILYIIGLASQTIVPYWNMGIYSDTGKFYFNIRLTNSISEINLIPFKTLYEYLFVNNTSVSSWSSVSILNIFANTLLFIPLGLLTPLIWEKYDSFYKILTLGLISTCLIEFIQIFIGRSTDIDDVILNTIGVIIGYTIFKLFKNKQLKKCLILI